MDKLQKMADAPLTECPACHEDSFQRLVSAAGFQLKGTGWYVTDFRNKTPEAAPSSASPPSTTAASVATPAVTETPATPATTTESA